MTYKHVIWDWNGTLLNDTSLCVEVLNGLLARRGRASITDVDYRANFGFPVIHFYEYLGFDTDVDSFDQVSREFIGDYEARWFQECALHADVGQLLAALTELGLTQSVLSAAKQEALDSGIRHYGIRSHFTGLAGTDNIYAQGKVARGRSWIEQLPWRPEEVVLIGDTLHDFEVAEAIGAECILLSHGHHSAERLAVTGKPVLGSMSELLDLLQQG
ncbi:HAD family hydrolase [Coraliomargarita sp. SDUM461004]|uniref:phosphoglycolate phosphatase n=1 Tax=Thalassobacterium sedimentorum TaxID=3041258 RepID=A0ABU1AMW5_9BACT|nr:HAD family hydrolase [Coraliomargarita sp. SDUM461004]MDQ8196024.1 HAD family hydrolase [Coraliomargarita sp. SDUM461004]